ncbi:MAG: MlaD family protein [Verrucomicrobiota bacterium]
MNVKTQLEWKVGLFALAGLILMGALLIGFSKATSVFSSTYELRLRTTNVGGIIPGAKVLMAGVPIGRVERADLQEGGKSVLITLQIYSRYQIHGDADFFIEQAGFLGDQYVSINPTKNEKPPLPEGAEVVCKEPFNFQEAARSALTLIQRVDKAVQQINEAIERVDKSLLSQQTLSDLTNTFANFRKASEGTVDTVGKLGKVSDKAMTTLDNVNSLVQSNAPAINRTVSNVESFSKDLSTITNVVKFADKLNEAAEELRLMVATNRAGVTASIQNVEDSTESLKSILGGLQEGKGLAGGLLKDEGLKNQMTQLMGNLTTLSSNLNRFGLLYKPKAVKTNDVSRPSSYPGRRPYDSR